MKAPFDTDRLDELMEQAGIDLLLATAKENVRYLLGGYESFLFAHKEAIGVNRHSPCVGYLSTRPGDTFYIGCPLDTSQQAVDPDFWVQNVSNSSWQTETSAMKAAASIRNVGFSSRRIGIERSFMAADFFATLQAELPEASFVESHPVLDELRAVKRPAELALLQEASECIVDSLLSVMRCGRPGVTTRALADQVMRQEVNRGLSFEYCLACTGPSYNRAPSDAVWHKGAVLSLDSGGNKQGYLGDLCRMAVMGLPTQLMKDLLDEVAAVQAAARSAVRAGVTGEEIFEAALAEQGKCMHARQMLFTAHGMGMIQHEAPHLTSTGSIPYPGLYQHRPIRANMVLSIETDLKNPEVGFVKLEDTVVVTEDGYEAYGDAGRQWTVVEG